LPAARPLAPGSIIALKHAVVVAPFVPRLGRRVLMPVEKSLAGVLKDDRIFVMHAITPMSDVSAWTTQLIIKRTPSPLDAPPMVAPGVMAGDGSSGVITFSLTPDDSKVLAARPALWSYEVWRSDLGEEGLLSFGMLIVCRGAGRPPVSANNASPDHSLAAVAATVQ
jgi:hypothetical protein